MLGAFSFAAALYLHKSGAVKKVFAPKGPQEIQKAQEMHMSRVTEIRKEEPATQIRLGVWEGVKFGLGLGLGFIFLGIFMSIAFSGLSGYFLSMLVHSVLMGR